MLDRPTLLATFTATLATILLILPPTLALRTTVPDRIEQPATSRHPQWTMMPVALFGTSYASGAEKRGGVYHAVLTVGDPGTFLSHQQIRLLVAAPQRDPIAIGKAALHFIGTDCVYEVAGGTRFPNNAMLTFHSQPQCLPLRGTPTGKVELIVRTLTSGRMALWAYHAAAGTPAPDPEMFLLTGRGERDGDRFVLITRTADTYAERALRRVTLLAYVWHIPGGVKWIWACVAACAIFAWVGFRWWLAAAGPESGAASLPAAFALSAAIGAMYAVFTPPFHAPDEPHHFSDFAVAIGQPRLRTEATELARRGHFERIQFHRDEQFRPSDMTHPGAQWNDDSVPEANLRGTGVYVFWRLLGSVLANRDAQTVLLAVRFAGAAILALSLALAVAVVGGRTDQPVRRLMPATFLLVPVIPFYGMHFSNYGPLIGAYVVFATAIFLLIVDDDRDTLAGFMAVSAWGLAAMISRSALPLAGLVLAILIARVILGAAKPSIRHTLSFWIAASAPVWTFAWLGESYLKEQATAAVRMLNPWGAGIARFVLAAPVWLWLLTPCAALLEIAATRVRAGLSQGIAQTVRPLARTATLLAALAITASLVGSFWLDYPTLDFVDPVAPPPARTYVKAVFPVVLSIARLQHPDLLTSSAFWGGFGWLETRPPEWFVSLVCGATAAAMVGHLAVGTRRVDTGQPDARRAFWLAALFAGFLTSLLLYALTAMATIPIVDLHGRYLVGLYLPVIAVAWGWWLMRPRRSAMIIGRPFLFALGIAGVHGYCLRLILQRYF